MVCVQIKAPQRHACRLNPYLILSYSTVFIVQPHSEYGGTDAGPKGVLNISLHSPNYTHPSKPTSPSAHHFHKLYIFNLNIIKIDP